MPLHPGSHIALIRGVALFDHCNAEIVDPNAYP